MIKKIFSLRGILIIAVIAALSYYFSGGAGRSSTDQRKSGAGRLYARVESGTFEVVVSSSGVISAVSSVDVKSRVGGNVEFLKLQEGDTVKKGDLVANIDKRNIQLKVRQSETDLKSAKASLEKARLAYEIDRKTYQNEMIRNSANIEQNRASLKLIQKGSRPEEISQGTAQLDLARANFENSRKTYERNRELFAKNLVAQSALDTARASMEVNEAQVRTAQEKLSLLKQGFQNEEIQKAMSQYEVALCAMEDTRIKLESLKLREQEINNLEAAVQKSEIIHQDAVEQLNDTTVLAPISGVVTQKWVDQGGIITSGISSVTSGTNIVTISDMSDVLIKSNVDETDIHKLSAGLSARVRLDAFPKRAFAATLLNIGPRVYLKDNVPVVDVVLRLLEGTSEVRVGMTADADIVVFSKPDVNMIPTDSIIEREDKYFVKVVTGRPGNGQASAMREIEIAESNGDKTIVLKGLEERDRILTAEALKNEKGNAQAGPGIPLFGQPPRPGGRTGGGTGGGRRGM